MPGPAACQKSGRVGQGRPQSPDPGELLSLITSCLCCHVCFFSLPCLTSERTDSERVYSLALHLHRQPTTLSSRCFSIQHKLESPNTSFTSVLHNRCQCMPGANVRQVPMYVRCQCTSGANVCQVPMYVRCQCMSDVNVRQVPMYVRCQCTSDVNVRQVSMYVRCQCTSDVNVHQVPMYVRCQCT